MKEIDKLSLRVLWLFGEWQRETLDLHELFEAGDSNDPETRTAVFYRVEQLVEEGLLEEQGNDFYALTDEGRRVARDTLNVGNRNDEQLSF
jgi:predicted transcriptional regulator